MPAASGTPPPTIAMPGTIPLSMLPTCIDPPLPRQQPVDGAEELEQQLLDRQPLGQGMAVSAEGGSDEVLRLQRRADAHGRRLLALALVDRPGHRALEEQELHPVLELADQHHPPVEIHQERAVVGSRIVPRRRPAPRRRPRLPVAREERAATARILLDRSSGGLRLRGGCQPGGPRDDPGRAGDRPDRVGGDARRARRPAPTTDRSRRPRRHRTSRSAGPWPPRCRPRPRSRGASRRRPTRPPGSPCRSRPPAAARPAGPAGRPRPATSPA